MNRRIWLSGLLLAGASLCSAQSPTFTVQVLEPPAGTTLVSVNGINSAADVVGVVSGSASCSPCVVVWQNGTATALGAAEAGVTGYSRLAINNAGQVAGTAKTAAAFSSQAVLWNNGVPTLLPAPDSLHPITFTNGINDTGEVVGGALQLHEVLSLSIPIVWNGTSPTLLDLPSGCLGGNATAVNASGLVVGGCSDGSAGELVWHGTTPAQLPGSGLVVAVNNSGLAVGHAASASGRGDQATAWLNKSFLYLGTFVAGSNSWALALNNRGIIVGLTWMGLNDRAALWSSVNGATQDLNALISASAASQIVLTGAAGINDNCVIAAGGYAKATKAQKAVVLRLTDQSLCVNGM